MLVIANPVALPALTLGTLVGGYLGGKGTGKLDEIITNLFNKNAVAGGAVKTPNEKARTYANVALGSVTGGVIGFLGTAVLLATGTIFSMLSYRG